MPSGTAARATKKIMSLNLIGRKKSHNTCKSHTIQADTPRRGLPTSLFIVTLSLVNKFNTLAPAPYMQCRWVVLFNDLSNIMMDARQKFIDAQERMLNRYDVDAQSRFINVPSIDGRAHVLVSGEGPDVVMINGIGNPGAMFAPLMAELKDFRLFVIELPGYGLTDTTSNFTEDYQNNTVRFLNEVLDSLELAEAPPFIANSLGSLWTFWLALAQPDRVAAMIHIGCPAIIFDTSAPFPIRLFSVSLLGRFLTWLQPPSKKQVKQLSKIVNEYPLVPELIDLLVITERLPGFRQTFLSSLNKLIRLRGNRPEMRMRAKQLAQIEQPTLIFWGKDDPFGPPEIGKRMEKIMPDAELHIVDGGHAPWLKQSTRIAPVASRFLHQLD